MPPTPPSPPARRRRPGAVLAAPVLLVVRLGIVVGNALFACGAFARRHHHQPPVLAVLTAVIGLAATSGADTVAVAGEGPEPDLRARPGARATVVELPGWDLHFLDALTVTTTTVVTSPAPAPTVPTERAVVHAAAAAAPAAAPAVVQPGSPLDRWPHPGPITGAYGEHRGSHSHSGIDLDGDTGDTIWTAGPGRVVGTGYLAEHRGYGLVIVVDHGAIQTLYSHLSAIYVERGQTLASGTAIGAMGTTGNTTGSHLHFEVRQGGPVDPMGYLPPR